MGILKSSFYILKYYLNELEALIGQLLNCELRKMFFFAKFNQIE